MQELGKESIPSPGRKLGRVVCHIPARAGSKRVPAKNLRFLGDRPMLAYAVDAAIQSAVAAQTYVNTDGDDLAVLAHRCGASVYRRPQALAGDDITGDAFTADFLSNIQADTLIMVSPVCPLITPEDIRAALAAFEQSTADTLISCHDTQLQTFCEGRAINIDPSTALTPTQVNPVVQILNWAVTIWDVPTFLQNYAATGGGYIGKNRLLWPLHPLRAIKISHEEDFELAQAILAARHLVRSTPPRYWQEQDHTRWLSP